MIPALPLEPRQERTPALEMAKLSELIPALSRLFDKRDFPEKTVAVFARHLRLARLLSTGGRGLGGADMTPADCTNMILAMTSGLPAKDAAEAIQIYRAVRPSYVEWQRDEDAPRVAWLDELNGAPLANVLERLIAAAMADEFAELGRMAMDATTARNWYVLVKINSPMPGGEVLIGGGVPQFGGSLRQYNKIIAAMPYCEPPKEGGPSIDGTEAFEKWRAEQRGWNSERVRTETIGRGTIQTLGALLAGKSK
jgi:hypothetical protein